MQREKVQLDLNVPVGPLQLMYSTGKMMADNGYGQSVLYITTENKALFLELEASLRLTRLELQPGECFMACKSKRNGKAHVNLWLTPETEQMRAHKEAPLAPPSELEQQLVGTMANVVEGKPPAAPRPSPVPPSMSKRMDLPPAQQPLSTGTHGPVAMPHRPPAASPVKANYAEAMQEFLLMAGRATRQAELVLGGEGGSVRFDSRDIAALATSMFIASDKAGYITWRPGENA